MIAEQVERKGTSVQEETPYVLRNSECRYNGQARLNKNEGKRHNDDQASQPRSKAVLTMAFNPNHKLQLESPRVWNSACSSCERNRCWLVKVGLFLTVLVF